MRHKDINRFYVGDWKEGVPEGQAFIYEPERILFNGKFEHGMPNGHAQIRFIQDGCDFEGELKDGRASGNGTLDNIAQKYKFTGEWDHSKPKIGTLTFANDPNISNIQFQDYSKKAIISYKDGRRY